jgi:hypothetical protein
LVRRKKRDIYGNWVWEDEDIEAKSHSRETYSKKVAVEFREEAGPILEWRDYLALVIASLETFLLPFVVLILLLFGMVLAIALIR